MFGLDLKDKATFFRQFATLIQSGVPVVGCLDVLSGSSSGKIREIIAGIRPMIVGGKSFADALSTFPNYFEPHILQLIRAGETSGKLEVNLNNIAAYLERTYEMRQQLISKMIYPLLLIHAGFLIPPISVLILKGGAAYFKVAILPLMGLYVIVFCFYFLYSYMLTISGAREAADALFLYIPLLGSFLRAQAVYRYLTVLSDMTEAGVGLDLALQLSADACGNYAVGAVFNAIRMHVVEGRSLSEMLARTRLIPTPALHLIRTGEQSGNLPFMLGKAAEMLGMEVNETLKRVFTVIPVIFYLGTAAYMGYIIITSFMIIYRPIFDINK